MKLKVSTEYLKDGILGYYKINLKCGCLLQFCCQG